MLGCVDEVIYGINVYRFNTSRGIPYQLTIQEDIRHKRYNVSLVDLLCEKKHISDPEIRELVSHLLYKFLKNNRHYKLYFDISIKVFKDLNRFFKFHRWSKSYDDISFEAKVTKVNGSAYIEVYIGLA